MAEHAALQALAVFAAQKGIRGRSFNRTSLVDPFARMLETLERWPKPEDRDYLRAMLKHEIGTRIERIRGHKLGFEGAQAINEYVDRFFDDVLQREHFGKAEYLLDRARLLKGAYIIFFREALPRAQRKAVDDDQESDIAVENGSMSV